MYDCLVENDTARASATTLLDSSNQEPTGAPKDTPVNLNLDYLDVLNHYLWAR